MNTTQLQAARGDAYPLAGTDAHRHGTWPAFRLRSSSVQRAKRHAGVRGSARTLGVMKPTKLALTAVGVTVLAVLSAALGAIAAVHFVGTPLVERNVWFEREMLHLQVDAIRKLESGTTKEAADVLRARSFYAVVLLTSDSEQIRLTKATPQLYEAAQRVCAGLTAFEADPVPSGNQKRLAREACALLR